MPDAAPLTEQELEGLETASEADSEQDSNAVLLKGLNEVNARKQRLGDLPYKAVHRSVNAASERAYRKLLIITKRSELVRRKPEDGTLALVNAKVWKKLVPITKLVVCNWCSALSLTKQVHVLMNLFRLSFLLAASPSHMRSLPSASGLRSAWILLGTLVRKRSSTTLHASSLQVINSSQPLILDGLKTLLTTNGTDSFRRGMLTESFKALQKPRRSGATTAWHSKRGHSCKSRYCALTPSCVSCVLSKARRTREFLSLQSELYDRCDPNTEKRVEWYDTISEGDNVISIAIRIMICSFSYY